MRPPDQMRLKAALLRQALAGGEPLRPEILAALADDIDAWAEEWRELTVFVPPSATILRFPRPPLAAVPAP